MFGSPAVDPYGGEGNWRLKSGLSTYGGQAAYLDPRTGQFQPGSDAYWAQQAREQAQSAPNREGVQLQYGQANSAYGNAAGSLDQSEAATSLMRNAAEGNAPSQAESLGRNMLDQGAQQQLAAASSAKGGPMGQASAMRTAQQGAAAYNQQGANNLAALRANEMATARSQFGQQAQGTAAGWGQLGSQYGRQAEAQGQADMEQRRLNQQQEQYYGDQAYNIMNNQANRGLEGQRLDEQHWGKQTDVNAHAVDRDTNTLGSIIGGIGGGIGSFLSDSRAKVPLSPMPGQAPGRQPPALLQGGKSKQPSPVWLNAYMAGQQDIAPEPVAQTHMDGSLPARDNPYGEEQPGWGETGGIQREDPYGSGQFFFSDPKAKQAAFQAGVQQGSAMKQNQEYSHLSKFNASPDLGVQPSVQVTQRDGVSPPVRDQQPERMARGTRQYYQQQQDEDEIAARNAATDQKTQASSPGPQNYDVGTREVERGVPSKAAPPPPKPLSEKVAPPLAQLQQDANRRGAGFAYAYKPEFSPPEQAHGELNWGPSADEMVKNPLMATAVKPDETGMKRIDVNKLVKNNTAGIASLQQQLDEMKGGTYG